jgi:hypothetical protein
MSINRDDRAVGGFVESLLAIMVVTVAVVLFTVTMSLNLASISDVDNEDIAADACQGLVERLLDDYSCANGEGLSNTSLGHLMARPYPLPDGAIGYVIMVQDLADCTSYEIREGVGPKLGGAIATMKVPISLVLLDGSSHAGVLEVSTW